MILHIVRAIFVLAVLAIAVSYAKTGDVLKAERDPHTGEEIGLSPVTKVTLVILIPVALAVVLMLVDIGWERKSLGGVSGLFFGVVAGAVLAYILGLVVDLVAGVFVPGIAKETSAEVVEPLPAAVRVIPRPTTGPAGEPAGKEVIALQARLRGVEQQLAEMRGRMVSGVARRARGESPPLGAMIKLLVGACTIYLCVSFVMQTKEDFRFIIPYVEFARQTRGARPLLLDTSVIIDGRIADISDTRILASPMIVPRFVLEELQEIADSSDKLKRNRGRRGLDMLNRLQANEKIEIRITEARVPAVEEVDEVDQKLVALAQHVDGRIVTNDYNLNKIAQLRGVEVININDLANALKPVFLPGETITVKIIKPGEEVGQGVGYLDDGTMIVAEQGRDYIGQEMRIVVTSVLQTSAGRMIFGRPHGDANARGSSRPRRT
jgi:uncharacterized protein YacL